AGLQAEFGGQARESFQRLADKTVNTAPTVTSASAADGHKPSSSNAAIKAHQSHSAATQHTNLTTWSFGELPELLEIQQGKQTLIGFPALVDKITHCDIEVFDDPAEATRIHRIGMRRLMALQMKDQMKFLEKNIPGLQQMGMQFMALGSQEELRDQIIEAGLERAFLQDPLPKNAAEFEARRDAGKSRLGLLVNEIARLAGLILAEYYTLPKKLQGIKAHPQAAQDMQAQIQALLTKRFIADNDYANLTHFPRYLKAINVRLEKLRADAIRDTRLMSEWVQVATPWQRAQKDRNSSKGNDPKMLEFRWLLEELRVSLFAQELRTPMPVSVKRLQKVWESMLR
ncbi:MAG TPA: DUF3418 domain-containing protein, partial [Burkholderiaceae bacterium]|nr:DUF3418 domain-containing protein [Burkholderiaceae bacterium]